MASNINDNVINKLYSFKSVKYNTLEHNFQEDYSRLIYAIFTHYTFLGSSCLYVGFLFFFFLIIDMIILAGKGSGVWKWIQITDHYFCAAWTLTTKRS